jgi:8-oxo-dGTP diphosphatase
VIDLFFRLAYRNAYRLMRIYWALRHPRAHGALVAIWHEGKILLVQNSYVSYRSLPGGYVAANETGRDAALRELREETGIEAGPSDLKPVIDEHHEWEGKHEHIEIFEFDVTERPRIDVDNREVVDARFFSPEEALRLTLFPPIRRVIERRLATSVGRANLTN